MGKVDKEFSGVWGSFGRAVHVSSIGITAKNTPNNTDSGGDDVEEAYCVSSGSNTITLCTREEDGLYVNGMNLVVAGFWSDEVLRVFFDNGITVPVQVCDRSNDAAIIEAVQTQIAFLRELFGCDAVSPPPPIVSV